MNKYIKIFIGIVAGVILILFIGYVYINSSFPNVELDKDFTVIGSPEQIERGDYLANHVALCMDCHSERDWKQYSGPITPGTLGKGGDVFPEEAGFPGTFHSKNITPAALSEWSDAEIYRAFTSGQTKDNEPIFPLMPYLSYGQMDVEDAKAIIAYLRSIEPIQSEIPESEPSFPFSLIMKTIPSPADPQKRPNPVDSIAYGKYMTTMAACADCHTPMEKGEFIEHLKFAGGMEFMLPNGQVVKSSNITPDDEFGIGVLEKSDFIDMFKYYEGNDSLYVGPNDANTFMPWKMYAGMTEKDLGAIYDYLRTVTPIKNNVN